MLTVWFILMAAMLAVFVVAWEPGLAPGWQWRLVVGVPIVSGGIAVSLGRRAGLTPLEERTSFWSYRRPNWMLAFLVATMVGVTFGVMV